MQICSGGEEEEGGKTHFYYLDTEIPKLVSYKFISQKWTMYML